MPNVYVSPMRIFTKISKVPFEHFFKVTTQLYKELIHSHSDKLLLTPSQTILFFFGFIISSKHITLSSTDEKKNKIKALLTNCLHSHQISITELARILGNVVTSFPAVTFGPFSYIKISLSSKAVSEIHWWINSIDNSCHDINNPSNPDITIHADASLTGWGITSGISRLKVSSIIQNQIILMLWNSKQLRQVFVHTFKAKSLYMSNLYVIMQQPLLTLMIQAVQKVKLAIILPAEYVVFALKTNCGSHQHTHQVKIIQRQASNLQYYRMLLNGNSIQNSFIKLLINLENQAQMYLRLESIAQ